MTTLKSSIKSVKKDYIYTNNRSIKKILRKLSKYYIKNFFILKPMVRTTISMVNEYIIYDGIKISIGMTFSKNSNIHTTNKVYTILYNKIIGHIRHIKNNESCKIVVYIP
ncbi:MAG: hypothetical protein [Caudoviricetes sp.]|nr:MAG: hypothetical protein [Caudoviricetes sp.]